MSITVARNSHPSQCGFRGCRHTSGSSGCLRQCLSPRGSGPHGLRWPWRVVSALRPGRRARTGALAGQLAYAMPAEALNALRRRRNAAMESFFAQLQKNALDRGRTRGLIHPEPTKAVCAAGVRTQPTLP